MKWIAYLSLTLIPLYDSYGISTIENSNGYVFLSYNSPGMSSSRTAEQRVKIGANLEAIYHNNQQRSNRYLHSIW